MTETPDPDAPFPGPGRRPPLRRSSTDYLACGVCGGLGEFTPQQDTPDPGRTGFVQRLRTGMTQSP